LDDAEFFAESLNFNCYAQTLPLSAALFSLKRYNALLVQAFTDA
jgi:hypothetical protein